MNEAGEHGWDRGWEEHKLRQLRERAEWSLPEKLRWLEEAQVLADAITKAAQQARAGNGQGGGPDSSQSQSSKE